MKLNYSDFSYFCFCYQEGKNKLQNDNTVFSSPLISSSWSSYTTKILPNQQVSLLPSMSGLLFPQISNYVAQLSPVPLLGIFSRLVHTTEIYDTKSCAQASKDACKTLHIHTPKCSKWFVFLPKNTWTFLALSKG